MRLILIWRGVLHLVLARQFLQLAVRLDRLTGLAIDAAEVQRNRSYSLAERLGPEPRTRGGVVQQVRRFLG